MMSALVRGQVEREGLMPLLDLRGRGTVPDVASWSSRVERADLLSLGAAADFVRRRECGNACRIWVPTPPAPSDATRIVDARDRALGTPLMRKIAKDRLLGPIGQRIVFDWGSLGLDLAQVALSFGASDLAGPLERRTEIETFVARAGYAPLLCGEWAEGA